MSSSSSLSHNGQTIDGNSYWQTDHFDCTMSHTRKWDIDNPNEQIRGANKELRTRLMGIVTQRNLNAQLPKGDSSSISEIVDMLFTNGVIPREGEGRSKESAEVITNMGERVDRGEIITPVEFGNGNYTNAIGWFDTTLPDIEKR
jgi:hypothetical protein